MTKAIACTSGFFLALLMTASGASADPPTPTPAPTPVRLKVRVVALTPPPPASEEISRAHSLPRPTPEPNPVKARSPAPLRVAPPDVTLGNKDSGCSLATTRYWVSSEGKRCLEEIHAGKLQVVFSWTPCASTTCATKMSRFEVYKVPRRSSAARSEQVASQIRIYGKYSDPNAGSTTGGSDVPIPTLEVPLPSGAVLVSAGPIGVETRIMTPLTTFVSDFRTGDCFAVRVQSTQGYFSGLGSQCIDNGTKIGMAEYDVPLYRADGVADGTEDVVLLFNMRREWGVTPTAWSAHLVADGDARCVRALDGAARSGSALNDDITDRASYPDLKIRLRIVSKDCSERPNNFRVHVIAPK